MREWRGHTQWRGGTHIEKKCIPHIYKVGVLCLIHTLIEHRWDTAVSRKVEILCTLWLEPKGLLSFFHDLPRRPHCSWVASPIARFRCHHAFAPQLLHGGVNAAILAMDFL